MEGRRVVVQYLNESTEMWDAEHKQALTMEERQVLGVDSAESKRPV